MIGQNIVSLALVATPLAVLANSIQIRNSCPDTINFYVNSHLEGTLAPNGVTTRDYDLGESVVIYSDAYGGAPDSTGSTQAGIWGYGTTNWYYLLIDPNHFNMGVTIAVNQTEHDGFCVKDSCLTGSCANAFINPPSHVITLPGPTAPDPPFYGCNDSDDIEYSVTFCSADSRVLVVNSDLLARDAPPTCVPPAAAVAIHPNGNPNKCLDVRGANYANGTPVQIYDCNGTPAQQWLIHEGSTQVKLANSNFCLDSGTNPANGVGMKIWQCYDNLAAQEWVLTNDNRIALTSGFCLDLTNGALTDGNQVQTWQCSDNNNNQVWTF
ncbi:hypothetical protein BDN72DRAFT_957163 [Pluteus cervinus]|uniref:Uncharacterized protein n=1 Tax=Pluteus cervinus TaxID=181527 RepID=A0ACD3B4Q9_9AGAR|nr:hypothetical protein BDN72DRAFT_957163 [Pluteus cervinus]